MALALAVLGWQGLSNARIGPVPNTASCHTCLRRLGLWMFKSKEVDPATGAVIVPAPMDHLEPLREHRFFCPWKNGDAQRIVPTSSASSSSPASVRRRSGLGGEDEDAQPGWEMLLQVLKNEAYLRDRGTPGGKGAAAGSGKPGTPSRRSGTPGGGGDGGGGDGEEDGEEDEKTQNAKDKERWARLRRVKSLLSTKGPGKLRKSITLSRPGSSTRSRPGTAQGENAPQGGEGAEAGAEAAGNGA